MARRIIMVINPGLQITPQVLPPAAENQPYSVTLRVLFGELPIKIRIVAGSLPDGLTLVDNGDGTATISGTPTETGNFAIEVEYEDVREDPRMQPYVVQVAVIPQPPVSIIVSGTAPAGEIGTPYTYTFTASGGDGGPYTWSIASGSLPAGVTQSGATISGTPTTIATYNFVVRATDGLGAYGDSSAQSVAIANASDPFFANVISLLHFDSVVTADQIPARTWTITDSAIVSTTIKKFGAGGASPITGMKADDSSDWAFGTGAYTFESWVYFLTSPAGTLQAIISNYDSGGGGGGYAGIGLLYNNTQLAFYSGTGASEIANFPWAPAATTWYHVAICRSGTSLRCFIDGTQIGSTITDSTNVVVTRGPWLGKFATAFSFNLHGGLDDVRVTKGVARYTANFTPPTAAFPDN